MSFFVVGVSPDDLVFDHDLLEFVGIVDPAIDADHCEKLIFQFRYEQPLV